MKTPRTRLEFETNAFRMKERIEQGRLHIPMGADLGHDELRELPNKRIDLLSINEFTRLNANMTSFDFLGMEGEIDQVDPDSE